MVQIKWTEEAENDLDGIMAYISKSSLQYAKTFFENVHDTIENLKLFPKIRRMVPESKNPEDRELILQKYRIIYRFIEKEEIILIMMIIHGSRLMNYYCLNAVVSYESTIASTTDGAVCRRKPFQVLRNSSSFTEGWCDRKSYLLFCFFFKNLTMILIAEFRSRSI